jgi:hypothetical protein
MASVVAFVSPTRRTASASVWKVAAWRGSSTPRRWWSWLTEMTIAAAEVNPLMTGREMKFETTPSRRRPSASWIAPLIRARRSASPRYSSVPGSANAATLVNVKSETMATGPTARCREEPNIAYKNSGTVAA